MNNQPFDWDLIRSFLAALEHGSLLGAARVLQTSQPTLGRRIATLEAQLGTPLFERTGRGLRPTPTALVLAESARQMEQAAHQFSHGLARAQSGLAGTVRISASTTVASYVLPQVLAQIRQALPEIQVELVSSNAVSNLLRREADIALRMVAPEQASLVARRVGQVTLGAYAHADYLARCGEPQQPEQLLQHTMLGHDRDDSIVRGFQSFGIAVSAADFGVRCDDFMAYWQMLRAGMGIGFVADYVARTDPQVRVVLPQLQIPALPMWLVVHREIRGNPRIRAVYDMLAEALPRVLD
jgi:DNA-binding transcriptional LysR family regulator